MTLERKRIPLDDRAYAERLRQVGRGAELLAEQMALQENPFRWEKACRRSDHPAKVCWGWAVARLRLKHGEDPQPTRERAEELDRPPSPILAAKVRGRSGAPKRAGNACSTIRALAKEGKTLEQIKGELSRLGLVVAEATIRIQFRKGKVS